MPICEEGGSVRVMPHEPAVEAAALSALAAGAGSVSELCEEDFYVPSHKVAFGVLCGQHAEGGYEHAAYAVADALRGLCANPHVRALNIVGAQFTPAAWGIYVDVLRRLAVQRRLMRLAAELEGWASGSAEDADTLRQRAADFLREQASEIGGL